MRFPLILASRRLHRRRTGPLGDQSGAIASHLYYRVVAHWEHTKPVSIRRCTRRGWNLIGYRVCQSAPSILRSLPVIHLAEGCAQLSTFWERITDRKIWPFTPDGDVFRKARNATSCWMTMMQGQPGFFAPRFPNPWLSLPGAQSATSYYDNLPLHDTLIDLVDFSLINERSIRFSVGAVNVLTGNFVYFDNATEEVGPEHVMASGALPPALPMVKIGTDHYWDGGIVSNTPLRTTI